MRFKAVLARAIECVQENLCFVSLEKLTEDSIRVPYKSINMLVSINTKYVRF